MLFTTLLKAMVRRGSMVLIDGAGRRHQIGDRSVPRVLVRLARRRLDYTLGINPRLSLGEAYMDGSLRIEQGSVMDLLMLLATNIDEIGPGHPLNWGTHARRLLPSRNLAGRARRNVSHHYDLSPALYDLFLDPDQQYSCAYFATPDDTLEAAQAQKLRHIAAKLLLNRPGLRVLDIGSGWGGLALFLARHGAAEVTGITLSVEQQQKATARAAAAGLSDRVRFHLRDYRQEEGRYDRIVSVGMFEHVGRGSYGAFFAKLRSLLQEDGVALLHSIGDSAPPGPINPFIRKYIFPGADIPSLSEVLRVVERSALLVTDIEILRLHYAETLLRWRERFVANRAAAVRLYDERFFRMWEFYLALCEVGFRTRTSMVFQMQLTRRLDVLPLPRDYMTAAERAAAPPGRPGAAPRPGAPPPTGLHVGSYSSRRRRRSHASRRPASRGRR